MNQISLRTLTLLLPASLLFAGCASTEEDLGNGTDVAVNAPADTAAPEQVVQLDEGSTSPTIKSRLCACRAPNGSGSIYPVSSPTCSACPQACANAGVAFWFCR